MLSRHCLWKDHLKPCISGFVKWFATRRILHFLLLGGFTFAIAPPQTRNDVIELTEAQRRDLFAMASREQGLRTLGTSAQQTALERWVKDEMLYREAIRLQLDQDDVIIRNRLVQKMLFHAEDAAGFAAPATDKALRAFYDANPDRWVTPSEVRFEHIFSADRATGSQTLRRLAERLQRTPMPRGESLGDAFPTSRNGGWKTREVIATDFGSTVAKAITALPLHTWSVPLPSPYGWHIIRVSDRRKTRGASFESVKKRVELAYRRSRKEVAVEQLLERLQARYKVHIPASSSIQPARGDRNP